jgi:hypothetical protein
MIKPEHSQRPDRVEPRLYLKMKSRLKVAQWGEKGLQANARITVNIRAR